MLFEQANRTYAAGARTWQITEPLLRDGHEVLLIGQRLPFSYDQDIPQELVVRNEADFVYRSVDAMVFQSPGYLARINEEFGPDAVIYPHASASFNSRFLAPSQPTWIDLNGHLMTEAQAKAAVYADDSFLDHFFLMELDMLAHGDVFSTVCDPQTWALLGELGLMGRLNAATNERLLVESIPVGVSSEGYRPNGRAFRGLDVPEDAFVVLWSGGYNTWTDVETMFAGLEYAMERGVSLHFVSTGGQIDGHDEITYPRMLELVERSRFKERFHLRGWIPRDEVPNYYLEADLGLNCEKRILEVAFGSKQRILDWSRAELPCLSSRLTELSRVLERERAGWVFEPGDHEDLGRRLVTLARRRNDVRETGRRCRRRFRELFNYARTIEPFREWAESPWRSRDRCRIHHCVESMAKEIAILRTDFSALQTRLAAFEREPEPDHPDDPNPDRERSVHESRLAWATRVTMNSYRSGGLPLIMRRVLGRVTTRHGGDDLEDR
jgi:glycosyltransferase involved in cell wall biosynthesis